MSPGVAELKEKGNQYFKAQEYADAVKAYGEAIALDADNAALYSNRSAAYLRLHKHAEALGDAEKCVKLKPEWEKGHFRAGSALEAMGDLAAALPAYQAALDISPMSDEIIKKVQELKKKVKPSQPKQSQDRPQEFIPPGPASWANGLSPAKQAEWLVDCYRMRVDDDYAWGGGNLHGLYDPHSTNDTITEDFLIFCKLAVKHQVIPPGWNWRIFLTTAAGLLPYAFEKSDAKEKWGGENVFAGAMGGRSLRYTGEVVYGSSCMGTGEVEDERDLGELEEEVTGNWGKLIGADGGAVFAEVGGVDAWKKLHRELRIPGKFF